MSTALRAELEAMAGIPLVLTPRPAPETLPAGIPEFGEIPRGSLTEIHGPASSGRTSMAVCALIDTADSFDPAGAAHAGVRLDRLLWVRCGGDAERALKVADLLIQAGGFGLILFDLGDTPLRQARRISLTSWFRLRRAVENTPSAIVVIAQEPLAKTCASLVVEMHRGDSDWSGRLLRGISSGTRRTKPRGEMRHVRLHTRLG
jgi:recombination protein RecA